MLWPPRWTLRTPMRVPLEMTDDNAPTCTWTATTRPGQPTTVGDVGAVTGTDAPHGATIFPTSCPGRTRGDVADGGESGPHQDIGVEQGSGDRADGLLAEHRPDEGHVPPAHVSLGLEEEAPAGRRVGPGLDADDPVLAEVGVEVVDEPGQGEG